MNRSFADEVQLALERDAPWDDLASILRDHRDRGLPPRAAYDALEGLRVRAPDAATQDRILDLMDVACGWCSPGRRIWAPEEVDAAAASMPTTVQLVAGTNSAGKAAFEEVLVRRINDERYLLLRSPGLVQGIAAGDEFELLEGARFHVVRHGGNVCVQLFAREDISTIEREVTARFSAVGGWRDGKAARALVFTVPVAAGLPRVEAAIRILRHQFPAIQCTYGNVYDPADGKTPLAWVTAATAAPRRVYKAIVWTKDPQSVGQRVTLVASSPDDADRQLAERYGTDIVYTLYNEEDAAKPRDP